MTLPDVKQKWTNKINTVTLGATKDQGGTRTSTVTIGGETSLPFLDFEGEMPNRPVIAMNVLDYEPVEWCDELKNQFKDVYSDPGQWAKKCVEESKADLICLRLKSAHPDYGNTDVDHAVKIVKSVLDSVGVPLIIWGCGDDDKDKQIMPAVSQLAKGENCLLGTVTDKNYKNLAAVTIADGHKIIGESPLDINIQKQVNILLTDTGVDPNNIVMFPSTGAMGYGMEYAYSIQERTRLACLLGDKMLSQPVIADVGQEVWRVKEARSDNPLWGDTAKRGILWETMTASMLLQSGVHILVMTHPQAVKNTFKIIDQLMKK